MHRFYQTPAGASVWIDALGRRPRLYQRDNLAPFGSLIAAVPLPASRLFVPGQCPKTASQHEKDFRLPEKSEATLPTRGRILLFSIGPILLRRMVGLVAASRKPERMIRMLRPTA